MQAIILLGGKGTRLSRLFPDRPKALAPVAGTPFLSRQLEWLAEAGIAQVHLAAGYRSECISAWLNGCATATSSEIGRWMCNVGCASLDITFSREPAPLGTGGGLKFAQPHVRSDPFLALNGDSLLPRLDFDAFLREHARTRAPVSIAVTPILGTGRYGTIEFDAARRILAFREKAERAEGWVNGGVYLLSKDILDRIPGENASLENDLFPCLAAKGQLRSFPVDPPLLDMGTPEGLAAMETYFADQEKQKTTECSPAETQ